MRDFPRRLQKLEQRVRSDALANPDPPSIPDIAEFVISDAYLNRPIYPRQMTLLKAQFLQPQLMTPYDWDVIGEWEESYRRTADETGEGTKGTPPGLRERMDICKSHGRPWFRETLFCGGRRGGKNYVGAIGASYVTWNYLALGNPQAHFGTDRDTVLSGMVFAGKRDQARWMQFRNVKDFIAGGACFQPFLDEVTDNVVRLFSPHDLSRLATSKRAPFPSIELLPKESTLIAGRGPASFLQIYDEAAHTVAAGSNRAVDEIYEAAVPALDQFGKWAWIYMPSSPYQKIGLFRSKYLESLELLGDRPAHPELLMIQLASWDIYKDWDRAEEIEMFPGGPHFAPLSGAIQSYDEQMRSRERSNQETFAVERHARFATVQHNYLPESLVRQAFEPWPPGAPVNLVMAGEGRLAVAYRAHADPSKSGANFGFAIGHVHSNDERGLPHVVIDVLTHWSPGDFGGQLDYLLIEDELGRLIDKFMPYELTFDQFNSVGTIQHLQKRVRDHGYPKPVNIHDRFATEPLNWRTYETFKTALSRGLVHIPYYEQADLELRFLTEKAGKVKPPDAGPVQTKDVADCIAIVVYELVGKEIAEIIGAELSSLPVHASQPGGLPQSAGVDPVFRALSAVGRRSRTMHSGAIRAGAGTSPARGFPRRKRG